LLTTKERLFCSVVTTAGLIRLTFHTSVTDRWRRMESPFTPREAPMLFLLKQDEIS